MEKKELEIIEQKIESLRQLINEYRTNCNIEKAYMIQNILNKAYIDIAKVVKDKD